MSFSFRISTVTACVIPFATRMCEAGVNLKAMQDILGHADYTTTMNIYTDATEKLKEFEISELDEFLKKDEQEDSGDEE